MSCHHTQLHMHVGLLAPGVKSGLAAGYKWAQTPNKTADSFLISCSKSTTVDCKFNSTKQQPADNSIIVKIRNASTVSAARPFNTVRHLVMQS
jgi:hypothetical protein